MPDQEEGVTGNRWPITLVRRGAKVPDDGTQWWQELPEGQTAEGLRSVGYEVIEFVPVGHSNQEGEAVNAA